MKEITKVTTSAETYFLQKKLIIIFVLKAIIIITLFFLSTHKPLHNTVYYNMMLDITHFKYG